MRRKTLTKEHGLSKKTRSLLITSKNMEKVAGVLFLRLQVRLLNKRCAWLRHREAHILFLFFFSFQEMKNGEFKFVFSSKRNTRQIILSYITLEI